MKAVIALLSEIWDALMYIPFFDTGVSFGQFLVAFVLFDVVLIVLTLVFRKSGQTGNSVSSAYYRERRK